MPERAKELQDLPPQAQAKAYFKCGFHHGGAVDTENGDPAQTGCVVCNAQVKIGEIFVKEKMSTKDFYDGKPMTFQTLI